jgi:hypothetical protein
MKLSLLLKKQVWVEPSRTVVGEAV